MKIRAICGETKNKPHYQPTKNKKQNGFKNKENHLDTDPESNHHRSQRHSRRLRPERLHVSPMRTITLIIIHCSATPEGRSLDFETCRTDHIRHRRFTDIGYHFYITRDGKIHRGRPLEKTGAHCKNHNSHSIGVCYEGGLSRVSRNFAPTKKSKKEMTKNSKYNPSLFLLLIVMEHGNKKETGINSLEQDCRAAQ